MPRPRSRDKVLPITIGLPMSLHHRLENHISFTTSRSKWVQGAIRAKLDNDFDYSEIPNKNLIAMLLNRGIISYELATSLLEKC